MDERMFIRPRDKVIYLLSGSEFHCSHNMKTVGGGDLSVLGSPCWRREQRPGLSFCMALFAWPGHEMAVGQRGSQTDSRPEKMFVASIDVIKLR